MSLSLHEVIDLPADTSMPDFAQAVDLQFHAAFERAAHGDASARDELLKLRVAYLIWAYRKQHRPG